MPWKETCRVNERMIFCSRLQAGERMTDLCVEYGISRTTGYKLWNRFQERGPDAFYDQAMGPKHIPHRTSEAVRNRILDVRRRHPTWGPKKIRAWLEQREPDVSLPAASTIGEILKREGLVTGRRRRARGKAHPTERFESMAPNEVWCADFKGQFRLRNGRYCYPLTITDDYSRYLLACTALEGTKSGPAQSVFEETFLRYGLPKAIKTDNGAPFASTGLAGLSRLSAWWMRLRIRPQRIEPGHPEQNGRHERMHLTLKQETTRPVANNMLAQQERFDNFQQIFNSERPHEALALKTPATFYKPSERTLESALRQPDYEQNEVALTVGANGLLYIPKVRKTFYVSSALEHQPVTVKKLKDGRWRLRFMDLELGHLVDGLGLDRSDLV